MNAPATSPALGWLGVARQSDIDRAGIDLAGINCANHTEPDPELDPELDLIHSAGLTLLALRTGVPDRARHRRVLCAIHHSLDLLPLGHAQHGTEAEARHLLEARADTLTRLLEQLRGTAELLVRLSARPDHPGVPTMVASTPCGRDAGGRAYLASRRSDLGEPDPDTTRRREEIAGRLAPALRRCRGVRWSSPDAGDARAAPIAHLLADRADVPEVIEAIRAIDHDATVVAPLPPFSFAGAPPGAHLTRAGA